MWGLIVNYYLQAIFLFLNFADLSAALYLGKINAKALKDGAAKALVS